MASGRKKEKEYGSWIQIKIKIKLNDEKFFDSCWMERKVLRKKRNKNNERKENV